MPQDPKFSSSNNNFMALIKISWRRLFFKENLFFIFSRKFINFCILIPAFDIPARWHLGMRGPRKVEAIWHLASIKDLNHRAEWNAFCNILVGVSLDICARKKELCIDTYYARYQFFCSISFICGYYIFLSKWYEHLGR